MRAVVLGRLFPQAAKIVDKNPNRNWAIIPAKDGIQYF
jgi:hypothetical protein